MACSGVKIAFLEVFIKFDYQRTNRKLSIFSVACGGWRYGREDHDLENHCRSYCATLNSIVISLLGALCWPILALLLEPPKLPSLSYPDYHVLLNTILEAPPHPPPTVDYCHVCAPEAGSNVTILPHSATAWSVEATHRTIPAFSNARSDRRRASIKQRLTHTANCLTTCT